jgi:excisionase family DNA binding protein
MDDSVPQLYSREASMNNQVVSQYTEYLKLTSGDKAAAASLTLGAIMLEGHSESPAPPAGAPLTVKEAASQLRVSTRRIYEMCAAGELRAFKVGRGLRITPEILKEYQRQGAIAARRREPFSNRPNRCL